MKNTNYLQIKIVIILMITVLVSCKAKKNEPAENDIYKGEKFDYKAELIVDGLEIPWGMVWLPGGDMLITERGGTLHRFSNGVLSEPIEGLPEIVAEGQGGLMDIELHPDYKNNGWIYMSYVSRSPENDDEANTAILRAKLENNKLINVEKIYQALPYVDTRHHYGCRLEFDKDGYLYFSVGERGERDIFPQSIENHNGKIHRINDDGSIPADNPFVNTKNAIASIYSYGHRNPQGIALNPETGEIWTHEHGPKGGDEINIIHSGLNYGWPEISFGINYDGTVFTEDTAKDGMAQPLLYWTPSIAPCGMDFIESDIYKGWKGNLLVGSLSFMYVERLEIKDNQVVHQEKLLKDIGRVRNVKMGPDGYIYVAVEEPGKILKIVPINN